MLSACSIIACNYAAFARVLTDSFLAAHPDGRMTVLLVDDEERTFAGDPRVDWRRLADLGLDPAEVNRLAAIYDVTELSTAVKPLLLRTLLEEGHDVVFYLDPDIRVYDSLAPLVPSARRHGIVLTPHTLAPYPRDGLQVDSYFILSVGVYNLGFVAVSADARPFLEWWWASTRREALVDVARQMFTDQRLIDFVPAFFEHCIEKDPGYNVAYWNLHERRIARADARYTVNGVPLRFFHFSGFDLRRPWMLSKHQGERPRILLSERPEVAVLCRHYAQELAGAGAGAAGERSYGWSALASGLALTSRMRRLYWRALMAAERHDGRLPPNPFDDEDAFLAWLNAPEPDGPPQVSRYLLSIHRDRVDLQLRFASLLGREAGHFFDWLWRYGIAPEVVPRELMPPPTAGEPVETPRAPSAARGVTIAGYFRAELGVGQAGRLLTRGVEAAGEPTATFTWDATLSRQQHAHLDRRAMASSDIVIIAVNADSVARFVESAGRDLVDGAYRIGYWFWETEVFPPSMHHAFEHVDEVWTATDFVASAIRRAAGGVEVHTIPLPLALPDSASGAAPGPDLVPSGRFVFLFCFDYMSVAERKNPLGLIEAFTRAFPEAGGPLLVLKTINGHLQAAERERVRLAAMVNRDILVLDDYLDAAGQQALMARCDCYVSLHRSEGLGLTMAEAMALGKPVIATAYSGNLQFMTDENSFLVRAHAAGIPSGCEPYVVGSPWAEPDLEHAAQLMREVFAGGRDVEGRAARGQSDLSRHHGLDASAAAIAARLAAIRAARSRLAPGSAPRPRERTMSHEIPDTRETSASDPIEAMLPRLEHLATPRLGTGGRLAGVRVAAQRALLRILRPYWFQQAQFQHTLVGSLRQIVAALRHEERQRRALEDSVRQLTHDLTGARREAQKLAERIDVAARGRTED